MPRINLSEVHAAIKKIKEEKSCSYVEARKEFWKNYKRIETTPIDKQACTCSK